MAGKGNVVSRVQALCAPIAADLGLSLWDVRFVKEGTQHYLQYIGAPVLVRTIRPVDGARDFSGTLEQYNNGEITVRLTSGKALCVQKKDTAFVKLDDFNIADFEQDFQG